MTAVTPAPRVVCIGVATLDAIVRVDRVPGADERVPGRDGRLAGGGVAATAAVTLARLGVPVAFIGRVADDEVGRWIRDGLASEGVDVTGLRLAHGRSPLSAVLVDGSGGRSLAPYAGDAGPIELGDGDLQRCGDAEWVHLDHAGYPAWRASGPAGGGARISLDGGVPIPGLTLDGIDLYAPTETALLDRYPGRSLEAALEAALGEGPSLVVATRGAEGSVAAKRGAPGASPRHHAAAASALSSRSADGSTLGAGDVFHGALLAALVEPLPIDEALRFANTVAALSCRGLDGRSAIPTRSDLEEQRVTV